MKDTGDDQERQLHMKVDKVDAEKIINHINYTKHWLDRADEDYKNKRFGSGSMILGLARAEITAAWEEALQLKTQVLHKMPKKAASMASWKNASAAGLLAAGFLIAVMVIQFGNTNITGKPPQRDAGMQTVIVTEQAAPVKQTAPAIATPAPATPVTPATEAAPAPEVAEPAQTLGATGKHPQPARRPARTGGNESVFTGASQAPVAAAPQPAVAPQPESAHAAPAAAPEPIVIRVMVPENRPAPVQQPVKPRQNIDGIDLYRTANDALNK